MEFEELNNSKESRLPSERSLSPEKGYCQGHEIDHMDDSEDREEGISAPERNSAHELKRVKIMCGSIITILVAICLILLFLLIQSQIGTPQPQGRNQAQRESATSDIPISNHTQNSTTKNQPPPKKQKLSPKTSPESQEKRGKSKAQTSQSTEKQARFPHIFWIYTENERDAELMETDMFINYYDHFAKKTGYQVRQVNSWSAYDWISNETSSKITQVRQNALIDEPVHSILKLALLYENGGIMATPNNIFVSESFQFIEGMFDPVGQSFPFKYNCRQSDASLYIPYRNDNKFGISFATSLMAAVPQSPKLKQAFDALAQVVTTGQIPDNDHLKILLWNEDLSVKYMKNSLQDILNLVFYLSMKMPEGGKTMSLCELGMQSTQEQIIISLLGKGLQEQRLILLRPDFQVVTQVKGKIPIQVISDISPATSFQLGSALVMGIVGPSTIPSQSLMYKVFSTPRNKEIYLLPANEKRVQLCLVIMDPLKEEEIDLATSTIKSQTFTDWKLYFPATDYEGEPKEVRRNIFKMKALSNKVHNIEKAVAKYCPHKGYAFLLNKGDMFVSAIALEDIVKQIKNYHTAGLFVNILLPDGKQRKPENSYAKFDRLKEGIVNPNLTKLNGILNHFRVFSVQTFKHIPKVLMTDIYGNYFEDRTIFLMDLIDYARKPFPNNGHTNFVRKKYFDLWQLPLKYQLSHVQIYVKSWEEVSQEQLAITNNRISGYTLADSFQILFKHRLPFPQMVAYNNGENFISVDDKTGPQLIPRKIHQVWLGGPVPPIKNYLFEKTKKMYPSYEVKLWGQNDITPENFPESHDIIRNIIRFEKCSPYKKLATAADIMRHEILYNEGGFWKDAGMDLLRPIFDKFLKYKLVIHLDIVGAFRIRQGMCLYGHVPRLQNARRINNFRNLNRMRIFTGDPFPIAGPIDWRQIVHRQEQYNPEFLMIPLERFNPGPFYFHPEPDACVTQELQPGQEAEAFEKGWYLKKNCDKKYPNAFGNEHTIIGLSWTGRRNRTC